jgi:hypothetical protein
MPMRPILIAAALALSTAAAAKDRATFLTGQYATAAQCEKLRKVEAGGPKNVGTVPELLDADGFHNWESSCEFTKIFEHEPGKQWLALMICSEGPSVTPETYVFSKNDGENSFDVSDSDDEAPDTFTRCDAEAKKGN